MRVKIAVNRTFKGKPTGNNLKAFFAVYNGNFANYELSPDELGRAIAAGYGITTQHAEYRKAANFIAGQHLGLDYDTGDHISLDNLLTDPFIAAHASILYETPSHTQQHPRGRVIFILDEPIESAAEYKRLAVAFVWKFAGQVDKSCKDACRLFFGAKEGGRVIVRPNILPLAVMRDILSDYEAEQAARPTIDGETRSAAEAADGQIARYIRATVDGVLSALESCKEGGTGENSRHDTLLAAAVRLHGLKQATWLDQDGAAELADIDALLLQAARANKYIEKYTQAAAERVISDGKAYATPANEPKFKQWEEEQEEAEEYDRLETSQAWRQSPTADNGPAQRIIFPADTPLVFPPGTAARQADGRIEARLTLSELRRAAAYAQMGRALA